MLSGGEGEGAGKGVGTGASEFPVGLAENVKPDGPDMEANGQEEGGKHWLGGSLHGTAPK